MPITTVKGDVRLTTAHTILLGLNTSGRAEVNPLETDLRDQYPVFFGDHRRRAKSGLLQMGQVWFFREATPWLIGAMLREVPSGVTRLRHLDQILITLRRDWQREGVKSLAIAPLCLEPEWAAAQGVIREQFAALPLPMFLYEAYIKDQKAEEPEIT